MKKIIISLLIIVNLTFAGSANAQEIGNFTSVSNFSTKYNYWLELHRKTQKEYLYFGQPGNIILSNLIKEFDVNTGKDSSPTPLPELLGREYWIITNKELTDNTDTAPAFLTLDVPYNDEVPYGPVPYLECDGQCNWGLPGAFGLHGISGNTSKLIDEGSSGCIRHSDYDITYLYNILDPDNTQIRYYIKNI